MFTHSASNNWGCVCVTYAFFSNQRCKADTVWDGGIAHPSDLPYNLTRDHGLGTWRTRTVPGVVVWRFLHHIYPICMLKSRIRRHSVTWQKRAFGPVLPTISQRAFGPVTRPVTYCQATCLPLGPRTTSARKRLPRELGWWYRC